MDPDTALENLRAARDRFDEADDVSDRWGGAYEVVEQFDGLDDWLSKGGFPPAEWADARARSDADARARADTRWVDETGGVL